MTKAARTLFAALSLTTLTVAGCNTTPSEPPPYDQPDRVGSDVDPSALVGLWTSTPINPYPNTPEYRSTIEYRSDGTVVGELILDEDEEIDEEIDDFFHYAMSGRWSVVDGAVVHEDIEMESLTDNAFARLLSGVINSASRDLGGTADIVELEPDRIVMMAETGIATRYDRLP